MKKGLLTTILKNYTRRSYLLPYELDEMNVIIKPVLGGTFSINKDGAIVYKKKAFILHFEDADELYLFLRGEVTKYNIKHGIANKDFIYVKQINKQGKLVSVKKRNVANIFRESHR